MIKCDAITGLILAGGRASRMDYLDKGLQLLDEKPLVQHVAERLAPQVSTVIISANRNQEHYQNFAQSVVSDQDPNFAGPLAGMVSAWEHCDTDYLLTVPCDSPFLPLDLATRLAQAISATGGTALAAIAVTRSAEENTQAQIHPVFNLMHRDAAPILRQFVANGGNRVRVFFESIQAQQVHFDHAIAFTNINTQHDLLRYSGIGMSDVTARYDTNLAGQNGDDSYVNDATQRT
ncbi:molybdenum cofactor guanylyltransferase MobA [Undibacterium cyanobacteriorum]|uniref:Molybdenum cofactor guanylyltransferase n=1 Tax=Undibacterium cyanobacteriorum TaxID=3073561 RepID=A0ABY9RD95_9BURK|nr:molybdenum cofactor guanylyltransferase MobA [Undibacterium sp. 20NA77.5]WMW79203.1 molybdenum cofactor guanylyltransferase MobA [Undibacterium sp. 20NA77.5]